jgi:hypothetical protein
MEIARGLNLVKKFYVGQSKFNEVKKLCKLMEKNKIIKKDKN